MCQRNIALNGHLTAAAGEARWLFPWGPVLRQQGRALWTLTLGDGACPSPFRAQRWLPGASRVRTPSSHPPLLPAPLPCPEAGPSLLVSQLLVRPAQGVLREASSVRRRPGPFSLHWRLCSVESELSLWLLALVVWPLPAPPPCPAHGLAARPWSSEPGPTLVTSASLCPDRTDP